MYTSINEFNKQFRKSFITPFSHEKKERHHTLNEAVYREGYMCLESIQKKSKQVFNDAADIGAPVKKGDATWNEVKQLFEWYGDDGSKKKETEDSYSFTFTLMDEWAVSDERKSVKEATEKYKLTYTNLENYKNKPYLNPQFKGMDAFVTIDKINGIKESFNPTDSISVDVPLFIRLLEYAKEDAKTDMDLHRLAENAIELMKTKGSLNMSDYEALVAKKPRTPRNITPVFDRTPEELKGNSAMKKHFIDTLLSGPAKFTDLVSGPWQNASAFRHLLTQNNVIARNEENKHYDFTPEYKQKHNL